MDTPELASDDGFRQLGHALIDKIADHLDSLDRAPVRSPDGPRELLTRFALDPTGGADPLELWQRYLDSAHHIRHPRSVGHQVAPPHPLTAMTQLVRSLHANSSAIFEMGPAATATERHMVQWMADRLGLPTESSGGVLTSGGSLGNLTALLAMRQAQSTHDVWHDGVQDRDRLAIFASDQTHYCVARALQVLGLGADSLVKVPSDAQFRLDPTALRAAVHTAEQEGRKPAAVIASACSTSTGAIDPIDEIADLCDEHRMWLHIDAAHGASFVLSERERRKLAGIERADSIVWDAHKTLLCPSLVTGVLFRDRRHADSAFAPAAEYLFRDDVVDQDEDLDLGRRTLECTKPALGLEPWLLLSVVGEAPLARYLEQVVDVVSEFAAELDESADFETAHRPDADILCFRHRPPHLEPGADLDAWQDRLRERVLATGAFYLTRTTLNGERWLRCTVLNPATTTADLTALAVALRNAATR